MSNDPSLVDEWLRSMSGSPSETSPPAPKPFSAIQFVELFLPDGRRVGPGDVLTSADAKATAKLSNGGE